jgi:hypothetical protein
MGYDAATGGYTMNPFVQAGGAYWVYVSGNGPMSFEIYGLAHEASEPEIPRGWSLMAFPGLLDGCVIYEYGLNNNLKEVVTDDRPETIGVWVYRQ